MSRDDDTSLKTIYTNYVDIKSNLSIIETDNLVLYDTPMLLIDGYRFEDWILNLVFPNCNIPVQSNVYTIYYSNISESVTEFHDFNKDSEWETRDIHTNTITTNNTYITHSNNNYEPYLTLNLSTYEKIFTSGYYYQGRNMMDYVYEVMNGSSNSHTINLSSNIYIVDSNNDTDLTNTGSLVTNKLILDCLSTKKTYINENNSNIQSRLVYKSNSAINIKRNGFYELYGGETPMELIIKSYFNENGLIDLELDTSVSNNDIYYSLSNFQNIKHNDTFDYNIYVDLYKYDGSDYNIYHDTKNHFFVNVNNFSSQNGYFNNLEVTSNYAIRTDIFNTYNYTTVYYGFTISNIII
jgi:hypothetical protein